MNIWKILAVFAGKNIPDLVTALWLKANAADVSNVDNTSDATKNAAVVTLTNKRVTKRFTSIVSHATPTIDTDDCDVVTITAQAEAITEMTTNLTGTPADFDELTIRILDDWTGRAITWGAKFIDKWVAPAVTTVASKLLTVKFEYDAVAAVWWCISSVSET